MNQKEESVSHRTGNSYRCTCSLLIILMAAACSAPSTAASRSASVQPAQEDTAAMVLRGRAVVLGSDCGGCHQGNNNVAAPGWLAGSTGDELIKGAFLIGPFTTRARNLTPDNATGIGRFSERQIFNALRYGLRPGETPDVEITSSTPGVGNFPANPKYLAPPMPWPSWRHKPDAELWAIAAYLKHGVRAVRNKVKDSEGPPDFWASAYAIERIGPYPAAPFPTANEQVPK